MNKHGQSLITFVLILPLLVLFMAFIIDSTLSIMEKNKLEGIVYDNMKSSLENGIHDTDKIILALKKNTDADITILVSENELNIKAKSKKKNIFGNIVKLPYYNLEINYCGNYTNKEINKKCG